MSEKFTRIDTRLIRIARKSRGMSQHQLASILGKSQVRVSAIEKGSARISMELAEALFDVFGSEIVSNSETNALREQVKRRLDRVDDGFIAWLSKTLDFLKA